MTAREPWFDSLRGEGIYADDESYRFVPDWVERLTKRSVADLAAEIERQDATHRLGYTETRDDVRLALATMQDELDEALASWRTERCRDGWPLVAAEILQTAAVALRLYRQIGALPDARRESHSQLVPRP